MSMAHVAQEKQLKTHTFEALNVVQNVIHC